MFSKVGHRWLATLLIFASALTASEYAIALTQAQALSMSSGDVDARVLAINNVINASVGSTDPLLDNFLQSLGADEVKLSARKVFVVRDGLVKDALGQPVNLPDGAEDVVSNNRVRGAIDAAKASIALFSKDESVRAKALSELKDQVDEDRLPTLEKAFTLEQSAQLKAQIALLRAAILIQSSDPVRRLNAVQLLGTSNNKNARSLLNERLKNDVETDPAVRLALNKALSDVDSRLAWGERLGVLFTGISLGSILLLVALGLAITYGLMGVINMAHGELMMIGAYATFVVQNSFRTYWPAAFDYYIVLAIPVAFLSAALVGAVLERTVIRFLYGRPLETLLATWGISLVLMQAVRSIFGAQNVRVENPAWLSGGIELFGNLTLPYNRIAIIGFALLVLIAITLLVNKTRLGLFVRSVTQNRTMAACVGVNTVKVDTLAFSLGAGIAGLAGCALSQIGNVGPDLGQNYIVDAFMVVVLGGVGQLAGTVYAALGLGIMNKLIEGWQGAVLAKIIVLVLIVIFIQKRPQGIFALKGRSAEN